ncbi:MAG: hypothetical protein ACYC0V_01890 [Armatimonadota bacterium]
MQLPLNILLLASLIRYLQVERSPMTCAVIWAIGSTVFAAMIGSVFAPSSGQVWYIILMAPVRFGLGLLYFKLLERFDETPWYWVVLILGLAIILF